MYSGLSEYIYDCIVPKYAGFDDAHKEDHALAVMEQAMKILDGKEAWTATQDQVEQIWKTDVNRDMLLTAAACHDLGLINGRENHHLDSGTLIRSDRRLKEWFSDAEIETIAQAAEDHRASGKNVPRSIYGMLVAEADRIIDGETIIIRTLQYGMKHYPDLDRPGHMARAIEHLREKYGYGGYMNLWIPWSDNALRLNALREIIADDDAVLAAVTAAWDKI